MALLGILLLLPILGYLLYKWSTNGFNSFEQRGIPYKAPLPLIGNSLGLLKKMSFHKIMIQLHRESKQYKIFGYYNFRAPFFIINDPELIKKIGVKDFDAFPNHQRAFNTDNDPLLRGMLPFMQDQRWKNMRNTMTPVFTGAKMRAMFTLMNECFGESVKYLNKQLKCDDTVDIELKECFMRLSNDLIATTAFGLKVNSFEDDKNEFFTLGHAFAKARGKQVYKFMFYNMAPRIFELLGIRLFDQDKTEYFVRLVTNAMKQREEKNIVRPDMIQLLMEAKKESPYKWSEEEIVSQCFIFFFAAFENNANLLCTTCHELMENPHIQQKLYEEVMDTYSELDGKTIDYDTLQQMKYMDMVVSESLRKWPLQVMVDRESVRDYTASDEDNNVVCEFKKGDRIWFTTVGLHWNEVYFEHPEIFDPERFSDENKTKIKPFTYLPFGVGPRICIGNRYALMQAKAMLFYLLKEFELVRSEKTCADLLDDLRGFKIDPKSGFWLKLVKRKETTEL